MDVDIATDAGIVVGVLLVEAPITIWRNLCTVVVPVLRQRLVCPLGRGGEGDAVVNHGAATGENVAIARECRPIRRSHI